MGDSSYITCFTSESAFKSRYATEKGKPFSELHQLAASEWDSQHLLGCRVICRPSRNIHLPILSQFSLPSNQQYPNEVRDFICGPKDGYELCSEHRLVRDYGVSLGQTFSALSAFRNPHQGHHNHKKANLEDIEDKSDDHEVEGRFKRLRRNTLQEGYVDSSQIQVGSSSSMAEDGSQGASSVGYVDMASQIHFAPPEDETIRLAVCVIRHILYYAPPQESVELPIVVELRDAKIRLVAHTPHRALKITAADDGGLYLRQEGSDSVLKSRVAMLEAKKRFQSIEEGSPVISDSCLAQMTYEALAARLTDYIEGSNENIILINATQHFMCFLQFEISDQFLHDFKSAAPSAFMYVNTTQWFDLFSRRGRESVVSNLCRLMIWARES
ncbi:hypothetical protein NW759_017382 [Fusarium solani]|nr:hypothetical protein NW759_017382 [Fusarium solani]